MEGNSQVEKYMHPVSKAISRHIKNQDAHADIYNRAYEAIAQAIKDQETFNNLKVTMNNHRSM